MAVSAALLIRGALLDLSSPRTAGIALALPLSSLALPREVAGWVLVEALVAAWAWASAAVRVVARRYLFTCSSRSIRLSTINTCRVDISSTTLITSSSSSSRPTTNSMAATLRSRADLVLLAAVAMASIRP